MTSPVSTGSKTLDRFKGYAAVKTGTEKVSDMLASSTMLSTLVDTATAKSVTVATNVATMASEYVPESVVAPVKSVASKMDELGDRKLQKLEDVTASYQEKINTYMRTTLPLDSDEDEAVYESFSVSDVKDRVYVNGKKAIVSVVPETFVTITGKSFSVAECANGALSSAFSTAVAGKNVCGLYEKCNVSTVTNAYQQCTVENAKKIVKDSATTAKEITIAYINTTKAAANDYITAIANASGANTVP